MFVVFFFKQKTAYEMRISDWSSDVCSSDLVPGLEGCIPAPAREDPRGGAGGRAVLPEERGESLGHLPENLVRVAVVGRAAGLRQRQRGDRGPGCLGLLEIGRAHV